MTIREAVALDGALEYFCPTEREAQELIRDLSQRISQLGRVRVIGPGPHCDDHDKAHGEQRILFAHE